MIPRVPSKPEMERVTDYYQVLGVEREASGDQIKSAYRRLAKEFHPDTNKSPGAEERFKEIQAAYQVLKDPDSRAAYDAPPGPDVSWGDAWAHGVHSDLESFLAGLRRSASYGDQSNSDTLAQYGITLEEAYRGKEATISCLDPSGENREIKFKIPPGVQSGLRLRFEGLGDQRIKSAPPGDLLIRIVVIPHETFERHGFHLVTRTTIGYLDACLGVSREIPTIEGKSLEVKIPRGIAPGQMLRVAGRGMMTPGGGRGDMMVEVLIEPEVLDDTTIGALEAIRAQLVKRQPDSQPTDQSEQKNA